MSKFPEFLNMMFNSNQPYNELPYLPPKAILENIQILKARVKRSVPRDLNLH